MTAPSPSNPVFLAYVAAFSIAAITCLASARRLDTIADPDTEHGLRVLLLTSGGWATASVAFLTVPGTVPKLAAYSAGLVLGFATVGAWLYFASAYTGRTLHRNPTYRRGAAGTFLVVVLFKVTNPIHGAYYTTTVVAEPFPHLAIHHGSLHWIAMGLAYALAFVGYFMLVELFTDIDFETRPIAVLVAITGLPVALDVLGTTTPLLVDISYEPLGVAVFALGVTYAYTDTFEAVRFAAERDDPTIALDSDGRIRDTNRAAVSAFPALEDARGSPLRDTVPAIAHTLDAPENDGVITHTIDGTTHHYQVTETTYTTSNTPVGRTVALADVTERERYRRELERQNDRLETLTGMIGHDLRNPLNVAHGQLDLLRAHVDDDAPIDTIEDALERMQTLVDEILELARQGKPVDETEPVALATVATQCFTMVDTADATLDADTDLVVHADADRLKRLLENLIRNSVEHGSHSSQRDAGNSVDHGRADVTITVGALDDDTGFYLEDDGPGIPPDDRDTVFESGYTTADDGTGFGLAIVAEIVDAHDWTITATESTSGGARFEVTDVDTTTLTTTRDPLTTEGTDATEGTDDTEETEATGTSPYTD